MSLRARIGPVALVLCWAMLAAGMAWAGWVLLRPTVPVEAAVSRAVAGDFDEAERLIAAHLRALPNSDRGHLIAAQILLDRPFPADDEGARLRAERAERAAPHLGRVRPEDDRMAAVVALYRGKAAYYRLRMAEAEAAWLEALDLDPAVQEAGWSLLDLYYFQGRDRDARLLALRLHEVEPDPHDRVLLLLELVRQDARRLDPAAVVERFAPVVERRPDDLRSAIALGLALVRDSRPREGIDLLRGQVERRPEDPEAWDGLLTGLDDAGQVEPMARTIARLPPGLADDPRFARHLGRVAQERGDWDEAASSYRRALGLDPEDSRIAYRLSRALRNAGDRAEADRLAARLERSEEARGEVGALHEEADAVANLGDPRHVPLYRRIADQRERMGRPAEAIAWHRLVLRALPDDPGSGAAVARLAPRTAAR